jgi:Trk K+ transport system NAD-binding subunit
MSVTRVQAHEAFQSRRHRRRIRTFLREIRLLIQQFGLLIGAFVLTLLVSAWSFRLVWTATTLEAAPRLIEALYVVLTLLFFQPATDFPDSFWLDLYFFAMPALGALFLTLGVSNFLASLVSRRARGPEWEVALASTYSNHIIVIGVGHVGIRVLRELVLLDEPVVIIEAKQTQEKTDEVRAYNIPLIPSDGRSVDALTKAGLDRARAVLILTNDDLTNLQIASRIRELNPTVRIVMRMFDDEFSTFMAERFDIHAVISSSGLAAPAFAAAAVGAEILQTFQVEDKVLGMAKLQIEQGSRLDGMTVAQLEASLDLSVVILQTRGTVDIEPPREHTLSVGESLTLVATIPVITTLSSEWNRARR